LSAKEDPKTKTKVAPDFEEALKDESNLPRNVKRGQIIEGKIIKKTPTEVWINLGARSEGVILGKEVKEEKDFLINFSEGDEILVCVVQVENEHGQVVLSLKRAGMERRWKTLEEKNDTNETVKVRVSEFNRGGLIVDYSGIKGFLPISQISAERLGSNGESVDIRRSLEGLLRKELVVKVIELDRRENKLIFSEKAALGESAYPFDESILEKISKGDKVKGKVSRIVPFGVLVDLGGMEGLVHISEVSWDRLKKPTDVVDVGQEVQVLVIDKDEANRRIHLSIKRLAEDPWEKVSNKYQIGQEVDGYVTRIAPFGAFVRLEEGIDGLVYNTQLVESGREFHPGDSGKFKILSLDVPSKRMNLLPLA